MYPWALVLEVVLVSTLAPLELQVLQVAVVMAERQLLEEVQEVEVALVGEVHLLLLEGVVVEQEQKRLLKLVVVAVVGAHPQLEMQVEVVVVEAD